MAASTHSSNAQRSFRGTGIVHDEATGAELERFADATKVATRLSERAVKAEDSAAKVLIATVAMIHDRGASIKRGTKEPSVEQRTKIYREVLEAFPGHKWLFEHSVA